MNKKFVRDYWNRSAADYRWERWQKNRVVQFDYYWTRESLFNVLKPLKSDVVLEIGCGPGTWTKLIRTKVNKLVAVDISEEMVRQARREAPDVEFHTCDALDIILQRKFDKIFSVRMIEYVDNKRKFLHLVRSLLKSGGRIIIVTKSRPCLWDITSKSEWQKKINVCVLREMLEKAGFHNITYEPVSIRFPIFMRGVYEAKIVPEKHEKIFLRFFYKMTKMYKWLKPMPCLMSFFSESYIISAEK